MWCAFVPGLDSSRCSVSRAVARDRAEELLGQLVLEAADRRPGGSVEPVERAERPARDVDRAGGARLVHRHDGGAVADDAGAVAERLVERLAEHDAGVLDGVVRARLAGRR